LDICDALLVLTADTIEEFDGDAIDRFIAGFIEESFLEYDKEEIQKMIDQNNETIKTEQEHNEFLSGYLK
jgi:HD superfamily phosphohydrolase YqeK